MAKISKKFGAIILALCMILTIMPIISFADDANIEGSNFTLNDNCLENDFLSVCVNGEGCFTIGTTGGNPDLDSDNNKKLLFGWPGSGTTITTIVVDGYATTFYNATETVFDTERGCVSTSCTYNGVKFTMILTIVLNSATNRYDTVEISYIAENIDNMDHQVGVRIMLDTMLGDNDDAPFRVSGYGDITTQTEFTGADIPPYWQVFNSLSDPSVIAQGSFLINRSNLPDTVHFTNWGYVYGTIWNDVVNPNYSNGDSAVTIQWNEKTLASGEARTYTTHYGLSEVEIAASENLSLGVTGDSILNISDNEYSPNPVAYNVYVSNTGNADAENATVSLELQENSLFSIAEGDATHSIDLISAGDSAQETFLLNVANSYEEVTETLTFILTDSNGETITVTKDVTIPALEEEHIELVDSRRVLLIQDNEPWDSNANITVLENLNVEYSVTTTSEFTASMLEDYGVVILANDQTNATYNEYESFTTELENFAVNGGTVIYGACEGGWAGGYLNEEIIGGIHKYYNSDYYNYVADPTHPIVTGELTDNQVLTDDDLYSNKCSHIYFDEATLPVGTRVILRSSNNDAPTLISYPIGAGMIIASGLTWEHNYVMHTGNDEYGSFALKSMDDYFAYAINYYNESTENRIDDANLNISAELDIDVVENAYNPNPIEYTIFIANPGNAATGDISFTVEFEENSLLEVVNGELPYNFGVIDAGETKQQAIQIYINPTLVEKTEVINFIFTSTSGETVTVSKEIYIPAVEYICEHVWDEGTVTVPANCIEEGVMLYTCTNGCGETREEVIPVNGEHAWDEGTVSVEPTCYEDGLKMYVCTVCGETMSEVLTQLDHSWGEGIVSVEPTCLANGLKMYVCAYCGETNSEVLLKLDHELEHVYEAPSCTVDGVEYDICLLCINTFNYTVIPAIDHSWGEGIVVSEATCTTEGIVSYTCANCGEIKEDRTPVSGHSFGAWAYVTVPTYREGGSVARTCTVCNETESRDVERVIPDITKTDSSTGVEIGFMNTTYGSDIELVVSNIFDGESYHFLNLERGNFNYELYDISTMANGEKVQPTGSVLVKFPIPENYSRDNLAVYYVTNTGTLERLDMWIEGDFACFEAEHFSAYTLVDESQEVLMNGDVTLDGNLTAADARLALRQAAGLESYVQGSLEYRACDINFNGVVEPSDARNILRKSCGLTADF